VRGSRLSFDYLSKIFRECAGYGVQPPRFDFDANGLMLTILADPVKAKAHFGENFGRNFGEKIDENLNESQKKILKLLGQNSRLTAKAMAEQVGVTARSIELNLDKLKELGFLARIGPKKGGHWKVLK
jgi:predicted HTH transcriptional regulator